MGLSEAHFWRRLPAFLIDRAFVILVGLFPLWHLEIIDTFSSTIPVISFLQPLLLPFLLSFYLFYVVFIEGLCGGRTIGKRLLSLRVVDSDSREPIGIRQSVIRNLLRVVDAFAFGLYIVGIGAIWRKGKRVGDLVSKSEVIKDDSPSVLNFHGLAVGIVAIFMISAVLPPALIYSGGENSRHRDGKTPMLLGVAFADASWWPENGERADRILNKIENANMNAIRSQGPIPIHVMEKIEDRDIKVIFGFGEGWAHRVSDREVEMILQKYENFGCIEYWSVGNEVYSPNLSIPREHLLGHVKEVEKFEGRTISANHMVLHAPDLGMLAHRGYGPIEFTDALGFNAYPIMQAMSWTDLITMWQEDTSGNPIYDAIVDGGMALYLRLENTFVEPFKESTAGFSYLLWSYNYYAELKHKPLIITEFGATKNAGFAKSQLETLEKFPQIDGLIFWSWKKLDEDCDGEIDNPALYKVLKNEFEIRKDVGSSY